MKLLHSFCLFFDLNVDTVVFSTVLGILLDVVVVLSGQYIKRMYETNTMAVRGSFTCLETLSICSMRRCVT